MQNLYKGMTHIDQYNGLFNQQKINCIIFKIMQPQANQIDNNANNITLVNFLTQAPVGQFHDFNQVQILRLALYLVPINAEANDRTRAQAAQILNMRSLQLPANKQLLKEEYISNQEYIKNLKWCKYNLALLMLFFINIAVFAFTKSKTQAANQMSSSTVERQICGLVVAVLLVATIWWAYIDWECNTCCQFHFKGKIIRQLEQYENRQKQIRMITIP